MGLINLTLVMLLSPLATSIIIAFFGKQLGNHIAHTLAIIGVAISTIIAIYLFYLINILNIHANVNLYTWLTVFNVDFNMGLLLDSLTSIMLIVVTSVSLMVHIYTIGYMKGENGYYRFFSYISLFTFMMLVLVLANNFVQLFFAWEGVGLVSYLLIGFYYTKESAIFANLKAFLINRIGDFGFLLGIALILCYCGSLDYVVVFDKINTLIDINLTNTSWHILTVIAILLFVGAMGKSAQFPLHVWLPDSMEGPTPISALIHAATMVTAGIFMVARLSPIYNLSTTSLSVMLYVGSINCLFLGLLGIIQNDIKRVVAYSTLSQLGYMVIALGCGAYSTAIFHLMTHAFFKGLLFLAAGSIIIAMHHEQDMQKMGGLAKYMPITYITMLIGSLALCGIPPFAGFFSKDLILEATHIAIDNHLTGATFAYYCSHISVVITAIYSFRLIFLTFHGKEKYHHEVKAHDTHHNKIDNHVNNNNHHIHEPSKTITIPLIIMAIASIFAGLIGYIVLIKNNILYDSVFNIAWYQEELFLNMQNPIDMMIHGLHHLPLYLAISGILIAYIFFKYPLLINKISYLSKPIYKLLDNKYFMDDLYIKIFMPLTKNIGQILWQYGDVKIIDDSIVNKAAKIINRLSQILIKLQTGLVNSYAIYMIIGAIGLLAIMNAYIFQILF